MKFVSKNQEKKCFATDGFGNKVDCKKVAKATNQKTLPNKVSKTKSKK